MSLNLGEDVPERVREILERQHARWDKPERYPDDDLSLRLIDETDAGSHAITMSMLGNLLTRVQSTLNWALWSQESGPNVAGDHVPVSVERAAKTEVVALATGSFEIVVRKSESDLGHTFASSVDLILDLASLGDDRRFDDSMSAVVKKLGPEATRRAQLLFEKLAANGQHLDLGWRNGGRRSFISSSSSGELSRWLGNYEEESLVHSISDGIVRMVDENGRFRITDGHGSRYEGRSNVDLTGWAVGDACLAEVAVLTRRATSAQKIRYVLETLRRPGTAES
jgi:hypothetical protein